jgi:MurNAc alpha-1-phosphate uridylyltransferase
MQCLVLAGGMATRLGSLTEARPKALLEINGRAFCDHQIELLRENGVQEIVFCIGHLGHLIRAHLQAAPGVSFVDEGQELRGTGGALRQAYDLGVLQPQFLLIYGDSYLPINYREVYQQGVARSAEVLMTVCRNQGRWDKSNARVADGRVEHYSKTAADAGFQYIDYGLAMFQREVLRAIPPRVKYDLAQLYETLSLEKRLLAYEVQERFFEVGSLSGIRDFSEYLTAR